MKKILLILTLAIVASSAFSQGTKTELTCYSKYAKIFEKRGAKEIIDGTYDDVIITIRKGSMADCFYGKVSIKGGSLDYRNMYLKFEDATYEKLDLRFKYKEKGKIVGVSNGISNVILTDDEELVNVLFVKHIKPKKKKYAKAAEPDFDL
jgi:hypothetical protein